MRLSPHLTFNGQCEAAFKFYEQCLGGKISMLARYGETPAAKQVGLIGSRRLFTQRSHWRIDVDGADAPPEQYQKPQDFRYCWTSIRRRKRIGYLARWRRTAL